MIFVNLFYVYLLVGFLFAIWFAFFRVSKIDEQATQASAWFKLIIIPGALLLWPIVLWKMSGRHTITTHNNNHGPSATKTT